MLLFILFLIGVEPHFSVGGGIALPSGDFADERKTSPYFFAKGGIFVSEFLDFGIRLDTYTSFSSKQSSPTLTILDFLGSFGVASREFIRGSSLFLNMGMGPFILFQTPPLVHFGLRTNVSISHKISQNVDILPEFGFTIFFRGYNRVAPIFTVSLAVQMYP